MSIPCPIAAWSRAAPDHPAVVSSSGGCSYAELHELVSEAVHRLGNRGVGRGDRVGMHVSDGLDFSIALWALLRLGATAVLLSDRDPESAVTEAIRSTGCVLLLSDRPNLMALPVVDPGSLRQDRSRSPDSRPHTLDLDAPATIVFTSGSEGRPKAVLHTLKNHWLSAEGSQSIIPVSTETRWAVVIPKYHVGGLSIFFRCLRYGGTVVVPDPRERGLPALTAFGATHVSIVPTQLRDWLASSDHGLASSLDTILVGGAPSPFRLRSEAIARGLAVRFTYGSSEMASQIATTDRGDAGEHPGYAGRILPHRKVRIAEGEILVGGGTRFAGYWKDGGLDTPFDVGGWFATGDLGRLDGNHLIVMGRRDNQFISGGENIYPEEIEEAIVTAGLADLAIVVPVPDNHFGARPVAYVRPLPNPEELLIALARVLPDFKIPERVLPLPDWANGSKRDRGRLLQEATKPAGS